MKDKDIIELLSTLRAKTRGKPVNNKLVLATINTQEGPQKIYDSEDLRRAIAENKSNSATVTSSRTGWDIQRHHPGTIQRNEPYLRGAVRNKPCPCGSGLKAKKCPCTEYEVD